MPRRTTPQPRTAPPNRASDPRMTDAADLDLRAYLRRIGDDGALAPDLSTLARLIARHAEAIAFENIDVLAGRVPALDLAALQRKLVRGGRGGYCFEQNHLFMACLRRIGFEVRGLEARVRAGVAADVTTARTHMALRVTLDGVDHLADVGFGALAPTAPLVLDSRAEQPARSAVYRLVDAGGGERLLQARGSDGWSDCYQLGPGEPRPIDYEMGNWFVATHPTAMLRRNLLVGRATPFGRLMLFNRELTRRVPEAAAGERSTLASRAEFADVLRDGFGLALDTPELDAVMAAVQRADDAQR